jgi:hypothetical protein
MWVILDNFSFVAPYETLASIFQSSIKHFTQNNPKRQVVDVADPHISLSRPFYLRKHHIERFISKLGEQLLFIERYSA